MDTIEEMTETFLRRSKKLSQNVKYSQKEGPDLILRQLILR